MYVMTHCFVSVMIRTLMPRYDLGLALLGQCKAEQVDEALVA